MPRKNKEPSDTIFPLYINGLSGRMIRMAPPKNKKNEILYIYGHHSSLERYYGVAEYLNRFAGVTVPDLPGFGGMEAFYKIGEKPTLDNMADYLAAFIKLRYKKNQKFSIAGFSLGFMIVTRMLQKYPEMTKRVDTLFSQAGFTHKKDFRFKRHTYYLFRYGAAFFSNRLPAAFIKYLILRPSFIRFSYKRLEPLFVKTENSKTQEATDEEFRRRVEFEVELWRNNDLRTYMEIAVSMLKLDLTKQTVDIGVSHVSIDNDRYFDGVQVEQHMRMIYKEFDLIKADVPAHAPSILATAKDAAPFIPKEVTTLLK